MSKPDGHCDMTATIQRNSDRVETLQDVVAEIKDTLKENTAYLRTIAGLADRVVRLERACEQMQGRMDEREKAPGKVALAIIYSLGIGSALALVAKILEVTWPAAS